MDEYQVITIDSNDVTQGQAVGDAITIGGALSRRTQGWNPFFEKGVVYPQPARTTVSSSITSHPIATCPDPTLLGNDFYMVDEAGKFYYQNANILTLAQTDSTRIFTQGITDIKSFAGKTYVTSTQNIGRLTGSNLGTFDQTWWTGTKAQTALKDSVSGGGAHMMESTEDVLYVGDGRYLHTIDVNENVQYAAMTFPSTSTGAFNVTCLIKHVNGRDLIAFTCETINLSGTLAKQCKMYIIDTVNLEFRDEKEIDSEVGAALMIGGVIFVQYAKNKLGYISDNGISFLRDLKFASQYAFVTKGHMANVDGHLWICEGNQILAYGDIGGGNKVFYYPYYNELGVHAAIDVIAYIGDSKVAIFINDNTLPSQYTVSVYDYKTAGGLFSHYFERKKLGRKGWIRKIEFEHTSAPASCQLNYGIVRDDGQLEGLQSVNPLAGSTSTTVMLNKNTSAVEIYLSANGGTNNIIGIRRILIYYEPVE